MLLPTPFDDRTRPLCQTWHWKDWDGYRSVCTYGLSLEREYNAIRQGSAIIDVSPLFKYDISGKNAGDFLARVLSRDVRKLKVGRMTYLCWTNDAGKLLDDGTCARLSENSWRLTAAAPAYSWLSRHSSPFDVKINDISEQIAALAVQGHIKGFNPNHLHFRHVKTGLFWCSTHHIQRGNKRLGFKDGLHG